jgi:hypothetical protein
MSAAMPSKLFFYKIKYGYDKLLTKNQRSAGVQPR